jgi:hypothetical protein
MALLPKVICRFNAITNQNSSDALHRNRKLNPKIHSEAQNFPDNQNKPEQKE